MRIRISLLLLLLVNQTNVALAAMPSQEAAKTVQLSQLPASPLKNEDILEFVKASLAHEIIVAKINNSACAFDTSPAALQKLKDAGVPDAIILSMVLAPRAAAATTSAASSEGAQEVAVTVDKSKIPPGTPIEIEAAFNVSSQHVRKGDRISFRVVNPVRVNGQLIIATGATATALVTKAERGGHFGRAGRLAWSMEEVTAVDGSRIPLQLSSRLVGDSKGAKVAAQTVLTGVVLWPIAPVALLHGLKRGENALLPAGKRFEAFIFAETTAK